MVALKMKRGDEWFLINGPEFTRKELKAFEDEMAKAEIAILEPGESVKILAHTYEKSVILDLIRSYSDSPTVIVHLRAKVRKNAKENTQYIINEK